MQNLKSKSDKTPINKFVTLISFRNNIMFQFLIKWIYQHISIVFLQFRKRQNYKKDVS